METVFSRILNMSLTGSAVILCVLLARLALHKAPKKFSYALWAVVLFRLLCPVSLPSPVSLLELAKPQVSQSQGLTSSVSYQAVEYVYPQAEMDLPEFSPQENTSSEEAPQKASLSPMTVAAWVWLAGVGSLALYSGVGYLRLRRKLVGAVPYRGNAFLADHIGTPFVLGVLFPKIYIPFSVPHGERHYILAHERCHIRRGDPVWKLLAYAALCIHWFNPLVWCAFLLAEKDMEMSCDEAVIRKLEPNDRADYASALLRLSTGRKVLSGVAFGESNTKGRILNMAKWKKPKVWVTALCVVLCVVVLAVCALNPEDEQDIGELTRVSGPHSIGYGNLYFRLPEGLTSELEEREHTSKDDGIHDYREIFTDGTNVIGGVCQYPLPEGADLTGLDWVDDLDLPEWKDETLGYFGGSSIYGDYEFEFFSDVPEGVERTVLRNHYFFLDTDNTVYDIWFDELNVDNGTIDEILRTVGLGEEAAQTQSAETVAVPFQIANLPDGYSYTAEADGSIRFTDGANTVGGVIGYLIPEGVYDPYDGVFLWLEDVGIPDFEDTSLAYLGGISDFQGGWSAEFASDVPEGVEPTVHRRHTFTVVGNRVYDAWFDMTQLDYNAQQELKDSVQFLTGENTESAEVPETISAEDLAYEKCRAVMDAVQSGSYHIVTEFQYDNNPTNNFSMEYYSSDELGWLRIITNSLSERHGALQVGDREFTNIGNWSADELIWTEGESANSFEPWLASIYLVKHNFTYIDTLTDADGVCCMLRMDVYFADAEGYDPYYFVNFYFDPDGNFQKVQLQVNLFQDDAFTVTESIVSLDDESIAAKINEEYQRAIAP